MTEKNAIGVEFTLMKEINKLLESWSQAEVKQILLNLIDYVGTTEDEKCLVCEKSLSIENRAFKLSGTGNYYSGADLDGVSVDGWICAECVNKIANKKEAKEETVESTPDNKAQPLLSNLRLVGDGELPKLNTEALNSSMVG